MKLNFIDSIRGVAILMVILVHTSQKISGLDSITATVAKYGQMGIQLFFIASAYTLCLSAVQRENESFALLKYALRRYFRIAPAYYLGLLLYVGIAAATAKLSSGEFAIPARYNFLNILSNLTFTHGFYPPANNTIVPGGWSIGTEMAFYALFPLLFFVARNRFSVSLKSVLVFVFAGIFLSQISLLLLKHEGFKIFNNSFIYFNILTQLPVFLLGMGYYFAKTKFHFALNWKFNLLFFIGFTALSLYLWQVRVGYLFTLIPIASGISFVFLVEIFHRFQFLNGKILIRIGQVSFSMYLLHFVFAHRITGILAPKLAGLHSSISLMLFYVLSTAFTFGFALLAEKYVEKPSIAFGKNLIKKLDAEVATNGKFYLKYLALRGFLTRKKTTV